MHKRFRHIHQAVLSVLLFSGLYMGAQAPSIADWTIDAPPDSLKLVEVSRPMEEVLQFNFKNISEKTIIEFQVFHSHGKDGGGTATGMDAFTSGIGAVGPGGTVTASFSAREFSKDDRGDRNLRVRAVVYADGSRVGDKEVLDQIEDEMVGAALEVKRDEDLLAASADPGVAGLDAVAEKIGRKAPSTNEEALAAVQGIALKGVPESFIDAHRNHPGPGFFTGVNRARQSFLLDMDTTKSNAALPGGSSQRAQDRKKELQSEGLADLARRYEAVCEAQAQYLRAISEINDSAR